MAPKRLTLKSLKRGHVALRISCRGNYKHHGLAADIWWSYLVKTFKELVIGGLGDTLWWYVEVEVVNFGDKGSSDAFLGGFIDIILQELC